MLCECVTNEYPNLVWALSLNSGLEINIFETFQNKPRYLSYLDKLIFDLKVLDCENIQEKMRDINTNLDKLYSIISELEIATVFAKSGKKVKLLPDNYFVSKSPDILCEDENFDVYVEVMRITESESTFELIKFLRDFLKDLPYRVDLDLKSELSLPARNHETRKTHKSLARTSFNQFKEFFEKANFSNFPISIQTDGANFEIYQTDSGNGYPGIINTEVIEVPEKTLKKNMKYWFIEKAKKRDDWEKKYKNHPYILAFDCEEWSIDDITINELLYGERTTIGARSEKYEKWRDNEWESIINDKDNKIPKWKEIEEARKKGWESLLVKEYLIPNNYAYLDKEGIFLSEQSMKNISGVLFKKHNEIFIFPNPFASSEINHPNIMDTINPTKVQNRQ